MATGTGREALQRKTAHGPPAPPASLPPSPAPQGEVNLFLRGGAALDINSVKKKPLWISDEAWLNVIALSDGHPVFKPLPEYFSRNEASWKKFYDGALGAAATLLLPSLPPPCFPSLPFPPCSERARHAARARLPAGLH